MKIKKWTINLLLLFILAGCDASLNINNRSGTLENDYVAEPLSERSLRYEKALIVSNNFIQSIKDIEYQDAYNKYFSDTLKSLISEDAFVNSMNQVQLKAGVLTDFKPLQWGFFIGEDQGKKLLYSVKITEHKKTMMKYLFVFINDGDFRKIDGFQVKVRVGTSLPGVY